MSNRDFSSREREVRYNTPGYYRANRSMGRDRQEREDFPQSDNYANTGYDEPNTGKYENYGGGGYYGGSYPASAGRDYEQNAGYRENYDRLPQSGYLETSDIPSGRYSQSSREGQRPTGEHRGKGPRNYERPDARVLEDVQDRLCQDPYLDASDIEVTIDKGEVVLRGFVADKESKRRAEDITEDVPGLKQLENRLRTRVPGSAILDQ